MGLQYQSQISTLVYSQFTNQYWAYNYIFYLSLLLQGNYFLLYYLILQKPIQKIHLLLTFIAFCGVLLIVNPSQQIFNSQNHSQKINSALQKPIKQSINSFYIVISLSAAVFSSFSFLYLHELKGKLNQFIALEYSYISQTLFFNLLWNFTSVEDQNLMQLNLEQQQLALISENKYFQPSIFNLYCVISFLIVVITSYGAHYFHLKALYKMPPSKISPMGYILVIMSLSLDIGIFGQQIEMMQILGILLTSAGLLGQLIISLKNKQRQIRQYKDNRAVLKYKSSQDIKIQVKKEENNKI